MRMKTTSLVQRLLSNKKTKLWLLFAGALITMLGVSWYIARVIFVSDRDRQVKLNHSLPEAHVETDAALNKLSFYEKAESDSIKRNQFREQDPFFQGDKVDTQATSGESLNGIDSHKLELLNTGGPNDTRQNAEDLNNKVAHLETLLKTGNSLDQSPSLNQFESERKHTHTVEESKQTDNSSTKSSESEDPEMIQLDRMMDKIIAIQHPEERKNDSVSSRVDHVEILPVSFAVSDEDFMSTPSDKLGKRQEGYFLDEPYDGTAVKDGTYAYSDGFQKLQEGSVFRMRLMQTCYLHDLSIPRGSLIYGRCSFHDQRLQILIEQIRLGQTIIPVNLKVYDLDGIEGLLAPGREASESLKAAGESTIQSLQLMSLDPSLRAQATSAGVQAAKGLLSKRVKKQSIVIPDQYRLIIQNVK
jgi:conjugative transposon TraM protein